MSNPFLTGTVRDVETALLLERANILDIGDAVAYTDGDRIFVNTEEKLLDILPAYDNNMLKWLLWHEKMHIELRHHNRFFRYLKELSEEDTIHEFHVTKEEVNIIMDILVHDSMCKMFPELIETALNNLAQMRNRNSLKYTFKEKTLEKMLNEYAAHKKGEDKKEPPHGGVPGGTSGGIDTPSGGDKPTDEPPKEPKKKPTTSKKSPSGPEDKKGHSGGGSGESPYGADKEDTPPEISEDTPEPSDIKAPSPEEQHDKTDWKKLEKIDTREFIGKDEGDHYIRQIEELKRKKFRLAKLTETLNGLATSTRKRTYSVPSSINAGKGVILKGRKPGKALLYLCFDASGSMGCELETFKEIISKSIPQAMDCPCEWFTDEYGKGKFRDIMPVRANSGFCDDGDRTIDLCWKAEQAGYSPIGVTDGGGHISWSKDKLKELKRTVFVGQNRDWLEAVQRINPKVQILDI